MDNRYTTFIAKILTKDDCSIQFELIGHPDPVRNHIIGASSTFPYDRLVLSQTYTITSKRDRNAWNWISAVPCDVTRTIL